MKNKNKNSFTFQKKKSCYWRIYWKWTSDKVWTQRTNYSSGGELRREWTNAQKQDLSQVYLSEGGNQGKSNYLPIHTFFFLAHSEDALECELLLLLIQGSGVVRPGQWARQGFFFVLNHVWGYTCLLVGRIILISF